MKFILGKKLEMTQIFKEDGTVLAVTKISAGPCVAVQVKIGGKDGYSAVQFGYGAKKEKNINKPQLKHMKGLGNFRYLRELRIKKEQDNMEIKRGDIVDVSSFNEGDIVQITGTSKGKGFQGVVKRHRFHGGPKSHGHKDQLRMPGSIGAKGPAHVFKGTRMGGQMGNERITTKNLEVVKVDAGQGELYIKGAVPGARNSFIIIQGEGEMEVRSMKSETESAPKEKVEDKEASKQEQVMDEVRE